MTWTEFTLGHDASVRSENDRDSQSVVPDQGVIRFDVDLDHRNAGASGGLVDDFPGFIAKMASGTGQELDGNFAQDLTLRGRYPQGM